MKRVSDTPDGEYQYLGNLAACEPWAAVGMSCDKCKVDWTGCWDNYQCPKCGEGELPWRPGEIWLRAEHE